MTRPTDYPLLVFAISFSVLAVSEWTGATIFKRLGKPRDDARRDFDIILAATLTLLALIIGFTFSMAVGRYDLRKNYEEAEANAIGTEYVRVDLLPAANADKARALLRDYLDQRVLFYTTRDGEKIAQINVRTAQLQAGLWSAVSAPAAANPSATTALAASGMNDVLNSQGYTQAAWWNRIPAAAWILMAAIAICCNLIVGYGAHDFRRDRLLLLVLPLVVSLSFFLIADIDSPRSGVIRVHPDNLTSVVESLRAH